MDYKLPDMMTEKSVKNDKSLPLSRDNLLTFVKRAANQSEETFRPQFDTIANRYRLYIRRDIDPLNDIHGNIAYIVLDAFQALEYAYDISVEFQSAENLPVSRMRAMYRTAALRQDYERGNYGKEIDNARFFKYFSGVGVLLFERWDSDNTRPSLLSVPVNTLILDPDGGIDPQQHRFIGMTLKYRGSDMLRNKSMFDKDAVKRLLEQQGTRRMGENMQQDRVDVEAQERTGLSMQEDQIRSLDSVSGLLPCVLMYATITDKKDGVPKRYRIVTDQKYTEILTCSQLKPITRAEKATPSTVPYPLVFDVFSDGYGHNPFEMSIFELTEDKQAAHSRIINLATKLISKNMTGTLLVQKGSVGASAVNYGIDKIIEVDGSRYGGMKNSIDVAPSQQVDLNAVAGLINEIERMAEKATGVSDSTLGLPTANFRTLGELHQNQSNANIRHRRRIYRAMKTMERLYSLWFRQYREYFTAAQRRSIAIGSGPGQRVYDLQMSDFSDEEPVVVPVSSRIEQEKGAVRAQASAWLVAQAESINDPIATRASQRSYLESTGAYTKEQIDLEVPKFPIEIEIETEIDLLSANIYIPLLPSAEILPRIPRQSNIPTDAGMRRRFELFAAYERTKESPVANEDVFTAEQISQQQQYRSALGTATDATSPVGQSRPTGRPRTPIPMGDENVGAAVVSGQRSLTASPTTG